MNRIASFLPGRKMTAGIPTIRRGNLQIVVVVDVTRTARHRGVTIRQRKPGTVVVELRARPGIEGMTSFASRGEVRRDVIGVGGFLKVLKVTRGTCRR